MKTFLAPIAFALVMTMGIGAGAGDGSSVGNGGGLSENNLLFAWMRMGVYVEACMATKYCGLTFPERDLLEKIYNAHEDELAGPGIQFKSSKEFPDVFDTDESGQPRSAVTGSEVGSPIIFNVERLYPIVDGEPQALDVLQAVGFLVHELGHHHGIQDHTYLDRLGGKVRDYLSKSRWIEIDLRRFTGNDFSVSVFQQRQIDEFTQRPLLNYYPQIIVSNGFTTSEVTPPLGGVARCKDDPKTTSTQVAINELNWSRMPAFNSVTGKQTLKFEVLVNWKCWDWPRVEKRHYFSQRIEFSGEFEIKELVRKTALEWVLVAPQFEPSGWRMQRGAKLSQVGEWSATETECMETDSHLNPLRVCD
ncbi:MAG: hypothetical protein V4692_12965 [Bdellovibrionota bacterium]